MKVGGNKTVGTVGPVARKTTGSVDKTTRAAGPAQPAVVTEVMGIPEAEFTPKVRAAIMALMEEVDKLRRELQQSQQRIGYLEQLADQDSLMPIANRRAFVRELSRMMSFAERYDTPSSVIYFDVNDLKVINDTLGHAAGDAVLAEVGQRLRAAVRPVDTVARLGGDEFVVVCEAVDEETALALGHRLDAAIRRPLEVSGAEQHLTASIGIALGSDDADSILAAADAALYQAKAGGRGRVELRR